MNERRNIIAKKEHEGVLDDKVSGKNSGGMSAEFAHLEHKLSSMGRSLDKNSSEIKNIALSMVQEEFNLKSNEIMSHLKGRNTNNLYSRINKSLRKPLGSEKSDDVANKFILDATRYNVHRAVENLVLNLDDAKDRRSNVKIGAFEKHLNNVKSRREGLTRTEPVRETSQNNFNENVKESPSLEKAASRRNHMRQMHRMTVRRMRRMARSLRTSKMDALEMSRADNGIELNNLGMHAAQDIGQSVDQMLHIANRGESLDVGSNANDFQLDALLNRGRTTMMMAMRKSRVMNHNLVRMIERDQQRVRS